MAEEPLPPDIAKLSFEEALAELEKIVRALEEGRGKLEDSIRAYERGALLKKHCEQKLREAQAKVDKIVIGPDLVLSSLSAPATGGAGLPVDVTDTTKNLGAGSAAASGTAFAH